MKPEKITCKNCGKQIDRGKFCSPRCKMAYRRSVTKEPQSVTESVTNETVTPKIEQSVTNDLKLTKTDRTFYDRNDGPDEHGLPGIIGKDYYIFDDKLREEKCLQCGAGFKTHMAMLKFCSYDHYKKAFSL